MAEKIKKDASDKSQVTSKRTSIFSREQVFPEKEEFKVIFNESYQEAETPPRPEVLV